MASVGLTGVITIRLMNEFKNCADPTRAAQLTAQCLAELASKPAPDTPTMDEALAAIAQFIPRPFTLSTPLPAEIRSVLSEAVSAFSKPSAASTPHLIVPAAPGSDPVLETATEREMREKVIVLHRVKLTKNSEAPWTIFYPHHWINRSFEQWEQQLTIFTKSLTLPDIHRLRLLTIERSMRSWFLWTKTVQKPEEFTEEQVTLFLALAELLAETYLLMTPVTGGTRLAGSATTATLALQAAFTKRRHQGTAVDFYSDLTEAAQTKNSTRV